MRCSHSCWIDAGASCNGQGTCHHGRVGDSARIITAVLTVSQVVVIETDALATTTTTPLPPLGRTTIITAAGVDLGTSGARLSIVEIEQPDDDPSSRSRSRAAVVERFSAAVPWNDGRYDDPAAWVAAVTTLLGRAAATANVDVAAIQSLCISGTSASCLIVDSTLPMEVIRPPRMYDYAVSGSGPIIDVLRTHAPARHTTLSPTSSLSKLLDWHLRLPLMSHHRLVHQADYVIKSLLLQSVDDRSETYYSDWHNCLKLGYDVRHLEWPPWLLDCLDACHLDRNVLPARVVPPGTAIGVVDPTWAASLGLSPSCILTAGTTDSNAAFLAAAAMGGGGDGTMGVGVAVTSLGSTMAIKQLSAVYVEDSTRGIYSHRFPTTMMQINDDQADDDDQTAEKEFWLVGGASNVGCAVLRQQNFTNNELTDRSNDIDPDTDSPLQYYPLTKNGERFPTADPHKQPVLTPVPGNDRTAFLHGILQGISTVERDGYIALVALGASPPSTILTAGGGARNPTWTAMRRRILQAAFPHVQVDVAVHTEASFGAALLAAGAAARRKELVRTKTT
jgi:D-ribulokinase